ncbi:hypothetical protein BWZ20_13925 [Winogradskyella sp. J14-2]|uniref:hypothetical protein n=1 Tax=Winogradskyella sp. J14-2 TaxID=1936080 RepID=UPI000972AE48|nr:hypothetical protein [Winogradskyella sp. J14-2]APY09334.1 hypothetical protein BWZ20_13925 [Winogradskyella sp. J14-2]
MLKKLKPHIPELFLIASVIYYWALTANLLNPFAIGLLAVLAYQIVNKKATFGLIISITVIALTLFLVLALFSELSEFDVANQNYTNLLIFGILYLGTNLVLGGTMLVKYLKQKMI